MRTQFDRAALERRGELAALRTSIERAIPLSAGANNRKVVATAEPRIAELERLADEAGFDPATYVRAWRLQLGSLGSGNHPHSHGRLAASGDPEPARGAPSSRCRWTRPTRCGSSCTPAAGDVGNRIASAHIKVAQSQMRRWWITLPDRDLAYLVEGTAEFDRYIAELRWAQLGPRSRFRRAAKRRGGRATGIRAAQPRGDDGPRRAAGRRASR